MQLKANKIKTKYIIIAAALLLLVLFIWWYFKKVKEAKDAANKEKNENKDAEQLTEEQSIIQDFATNLVSPISVFFQ